MENLEHLTIGYAPEFAALVKATRQGMASWANTGPLDTVCGQCAHYGYTTPRRKKFVDGEPAPEPRPIIGKWTFSGRCAEFRRLMAVGGPRLPADTPSCRCFRENAGDGELRHFD